MEGKPIRDGVAYRYRDGLSLDALRWSAGLPAAVDRWHVPAFWSCPEFCRELASDAMRCGRVVLREVHTVIIDKLKSVGCVVLAAALLAVTIIAGVQYFSISSLNKTVADLRSDNRTLAVANEGFATAAEEQNKAVEALKRAADERKRIADLAVSAAENKAQEALKRAVSIQSRPMSVPGDECASLENLFDEYIRERIISGAADGRIP
jgi:hypothetical protein